MIISYSFLMKKIIKRYWIFRFIDYINDLCGWFKLYKKVEKKEIYYRTRKIYHKQTKQYMRLY